MTTTALTSEIDFCKLCEESCSAALKQNGLATAVVTCRQGSSATNSEESEDDGPRELLTFRGGGSLRGELQWLARPGMMKQLAQLVRSEAGDAALERTENEREAFSKFIQQVTTEMVSGWSRLSGSEAELTSEAGKSPALNTGITFTVQIEAAKENVIELRLAISPEFCEALHGTKGRAEAPEAEAAATSRLPLNLGLLLDVELEAMVRVGEREMLLRDVFRLTPGAVVELDQVVNSAVSLLVGGKLVARGEIVAVGGNFAVQVSEVASAAERVSALQM